MRSGWLLGLVLLSGCRPNTEYVTAMVAGRMPAEASPDALAGDDPRPVVVDGEAAAALLGAAPEAVVAFAYREGAWRPIPVQVDERFVYDLAAVYAGMAPRDCARRAWCRDLDGHVELLGYADPGTHVGPDPDETLDFDDEIALMLADFGERGEGHPAGVDPRSAVALAVPGESRTRHARLYVRTDPGLDPAAGRTYVRYAPDFERGSYRDTYERGGRRPPWLGWPSGYPSGDRLGSNPEGTEVRTAAYALGFSDRWILDRLHLGDGPDLLDVDMIAFAPGVCWRSPYTGSLSEGGFLVNRGGPVRAIRHVVGFNSGPLVDQRWIFYARSAEAAMHLRVHPIPGAMSFLDLSEEAVGMVYRNAANPDGVLVDGHADALRDGPVTWEVWTDDDAGFAVRHAIEADGFTPRVAPYHLDAAEPAIDACMMDGAYYGAHGLYLDGKIPNTDPRRGTAARLALHRRFVFGSAPLQRLADLEWRPDVRVQAMEGRESPAEG